MQRWNDYTDLEVDAREIERAASFELGKLAARAEAEATTPDTPRRATPLETLIDVIQILDTPGNVTEQGMETIRKKVRVAAPFLPLIIASGDWVDWTDGAADQAISAVMNSEPPYDDPEDEETRLPEATYIVGLLVGVALAHALSGAAVAIPHDAREA